MTQKRAILLVNLGSPDTPQTADVRRYLNEFLMDSRVLDIPYLLRRLLVSGVILPKRPQQSAAAYQQIWWPEGSPLVVISQRVQALLQQEVTEPVFLAMRYGQPAIAKVLHQMQQAHPDLQELLLIPLYPHYAMSSFETAVDAVLQHLKVWPRKPSLNILAPFYDHERYIQALVENAQPYLAEPFDHFLFSYHGIPVRHVVKRDPSGEHCQKCEGCCDIPHMAHQTCYRAQVFATTQAFAKRAGLVPDQYSVSFQSRLGRTPWLQPFTDFELAEMPSRGIRRLVVMCPSFVSDCLETLEEMAIRGKDTFLAAGGDDYRLIPCLNTHPTWIDTLKHWCQDDSGALLFNANQKPQREWLGFKD